MHKEKVSEDTRKLENISGSQQQQLNLQSRGNDNPKGFCRKDCKEQA